MARIRAVLGAVWTAVRRDSSSLTSFTGNNFFYVALMLLFFDDKGAFTTMNVMLALVLFFPLSADPLRKVPAVRLASWPLGAYEHRLLRVFTPWLNPMTWLLVGLALWRHVSTGLWTLVAVLFALAFIGPSLLRPQRRAGWRWVPPFPGPLGELIRKNVREMLASLDFYCALMLSGGALICRVIGFVPHDADLPMTLLIMLALSTYSQSLFGLDGAGGLARYRLLPVPGWRILAAKDAAYVVIAVLLTAPWSPIAGLSAALMALALGHYTSVKQRRTQIRWRFTTGASFGSAIIQILLMDLAAAGSVLVSPALALVAVAAYAGSTWWMGREWERGEVVP